MPDPDEKAHAADPRDIETALALALTSGKAMARSQAAETMSKIVAERLVAQLKSSGFVIAATRGAAFGARGARGGFRQQRISPVGGAATAGGVRFLGSFYNQFKKIVIDPCVVLRRSP